ncbi:MAG: hypothetical protein M3154_01445, partial [Candidatus Eremiobacteraeota bacterium]|nr:hypothetical protein [Candidatus Eremiobacteraeota bacterium]
MKPFAPAALAAATLMLAFSACTSSSTSVPVLATPTPAPGPISVSATVPFGPTPSTTTLPTLGRAVAATLTIPSATGSGTLAVTASKSLPSDLPTLQAFLRSPDARKPHAASTYTTYFSIEFVPSASTTLSAIPSFAVPFDAGDVPAGTALYVAYLTGNNGSPAWTTVAGPTTYTSGTFSFSGAVAAQPLNAGQRYGLVVYSIGSGSPVGTPSTSPSPSASATSGPSASPAPTSTPAAAGNPASVGAYVLGNDANGNPILRAIAPGALDYGRTVTLPPGWSFTALDTDAAGNAYTGAFATVSGGQTGGRIDRYPSGGTASAASIAVANGTANVLAAAPDGTIYFNSPTTISYAAPNSTTVINPLAAGSASVVALRTDKNGNVYSVQRSGQTYAFVTYGPQLSGTPRSVALTVPSFGAAGPIGIDSNGTAYVAIASNSAQVQNAIAVIAPGGTTATNVTLATGTAVDFGFDANNNVYVANST